MIYLTTWEISKEIGVNPFVIRRLAVGKKIKYTRLGNRMLLIDIDSAIEYFRWHFFPRTDVKNKQQKIKEFIKNYGKKK